MINTEQRRQHDEHMARRERLIFAKPTLKLVAPDMKMEYEEEIKRLRLTQSETRSRLKSMTKERDNALERVDVLSLDLADAQARIMAQAETIAKAAGIGFDVQPKRSVQDIVASVLKGYPGVKWKDIIGVRRAKDLIVPRHECMYAVHVERPDLSFPTLGRLFARDHSSLIYAVQKIGLQRASLESA